MSVFITQLIYIKPGSEKVFDEFENIAIPLIAKYGGKLNLRIRPGLDAVIAADAEPPYELHVVEFPSEDAFLRFMNDEERQKFLHLKEASIRLSVLIKGSRI